MVECDRRGACGLPPRNGSGRAVEFKSVMRLPTRWCSPDVQGMAQDLAYFDRLEDDCDEFHPGTAMRGHQGLTP